MGTRNQVSRIPHYTKPLHHQVSGSAGLFFIALLLPSLVCAEGLWDKLSSGVEKGGSVLKQGAGKGLGLGGALTKHGLEAGKGALQDTVGHFYRDGTPQEIRTRVDQMAFDTLDRLFAQDPEAHLLFDRGHGYAVFEVRQLSLTLVAGYGYGVAVSQDGGRRIYMKMANGGLELGKSTGGLASQWVILFEDDSAFSAFVTEGFDASAEVTGELGDEGATLGTRYRQGVAFYRVTEWGLRLTASLSGTRFWPDDGLNAAESPAEVVPGPDLGVRTFQTLSPQGPAPDPPEGHPTGAPGLGPGDSGGDAD